MLPVRIQGSVNPNIAGRRNGENQEEHDEGKRFQIVGGHTLHAKQDCPAQNLKLHESKIPSETLYNRLPEQFPLRCPESRLQHVSHTAAIACPEAGASFAGRRVLDYPGAPEQHVEALVLLHVQVSLVVKRHVL